jgi:hypothetical protein
MRRAKKGICTYCGQWEKVTRDHVIPECLFIPPLPLNMITVKACKKCNEGWKSGDDSFLRDFLCIDLQGSTHPIAQTLFDGKVMRSVGSNKSKLGTWQALVSDPGVAVVSGPATARMVRG